MRVLILQDPLAGHCIFSGSLYQYLEETRKWRGRFVSVTNSYTLSLYDSQAVSERYVCQKSHWLALAQ